MEAIDNGHIMEKIYIQKVRRQANKFTRDSS
jgi:hypothetical protein